MPVSPDILIVEDGSIVTDANSYVTYDYVDSYHTLRGNSAWSDATPLAQQQAIIRATQAIDARYKAYFPGEPTEYGAQELEWPRDEVYIYDEELDDDLIPNSLKKAVAEATLREIESPNSLAPDLDRGGKIKKVKADVVEVEYADGASAETVFTLIEGILGDIVTGTPGSEINSYSTHLG